MKKELSILILLFSLNAFATPAPSPVPLLPPAPTVDTSVSHKQAMTVQSIQQNMDRSVAIGKLGCEANFNLIWHNSYGLTPQQAFDSLGSSAGRFYTLWVTTKTSLNTLKPGTITLVLPKSVTVNNDGTVTVGS